MFAAVTELSWTTSALLRLRTSARRRCYPKWPRRSTTHLTTLAPDSTSRARWSSSHRAGITSTAQWTRRGRRARGERSAGSYRRCWPRPPDPAEASGLGLASAIRVAGDSPRWSAIAARTRSLGSRRDYVRSARGTRWRCPPRPPLEHRNAIEDKDCLVLWTSICGPRQGEVEKMCVVVLRLADRPASTTRRIVSQAYTTREYSDLTPADPHGA